MFYKNKGKTRGFLAVFNNKYTLYEAIGGILRAPHSAEFKHIHRV